MSVIENAVASLKEKFGERILSLETFRDQVTVVVDKDVIVPCCQLLHDDPDLAFNRLSSITAIDYWPREPRFAVVYMLFSIPNRVYLRLQVALPGDAAELPTSESVYLNANWYEREVYDMFGIVFTGHSDLRRILMPYDWEGHPQRKDYPLGTEEVQFSFNYDEIDRRKPYAKE
jgi:NADH-quinone oxidoreductase subunit C